MNNIKSDTFLFKLLCRKPYGMICHALCILTSIQG